MLAGGLRIIIITGYGWESPFRDNTLEVRDNEINTGQEDFPVESRVRFRYFV